jgi:hypothetical protein
MQKETVFADGIYFKQRENAPAFVLGQLDFKVVQAIAFLAKYENNAGYVNVEILLSKKTGKPYCVLNQYQKPDKTQDEVKNQEELSNIQNSVQENQYEENINPEDIPF